MHAADDDDFTTLIATIMNPAEQRQRFTAVQTVERRVDDLEMVLQGLAQQIVADREAQAAHIQAVQAWTAGKERFLDSTRRMSAPSVWHCSHVVRSDGTPRRGPRNGSLTTGCARTT